MGLDLSPFRIALARLNLEDLAAAFDVVVSIESSSMVASFDASSSCTMLMSSGSFFALKEALVMADLEIEWAEVEGVTAIIPRRLSLELDTTVCRLLVIALVTNKTSAYSS